MANLKLIDDLKLVDAAKTQGAYFNAALKSALSGKRIVGDVRGEGLLAAVEVVADKDSRTFFDPAQKIGPQLAAAMLEQGIIARAMPQGDILGFAPPFCVSTSELDRIVDATAKAVDKVTATL